MYLIDARTPDQFKVCVRKCGFNQGQAPDGLSSMYAPGTLSGITPLLSYSLPACLPPPSSFPLPVLAREPHCQSDSPPHSPPLSPPIVLSVAGATALPTHSPFLFSSRCPCITPPSSCIRAVTLPEPSTFPRATASCPPSTSHCPPSPRTRCVHTLHSKLTIICCPKSINQSSDISSHMPDLPVGHALIPLNYTT